MFEFIQSKSLSLEQALQHSKKHKETSNFLDHIDFKARLKEASHNDVDAQIDVAMCYFYGKGVKKSYSKAFEYCKKAADQGDPFAEYQIGYFYEKGYGTKKSEDLAFKYYKKAVDQNGVCAFYHLASCYLNGIGTEKSLEKAIHYFELSMNEGDIYSIKQLANIYKNAYGQCKVKHAKELADYYLKKLFLINKKQADEGDPRSQNDLGEAFEEGNGTEVSLSLAFYYYSLSAQQKHKKAYLNLARCYRYGLGVTKSNDEAIKYYKLAISELFFAGTSIFSCCDLLQELNRYEEANDYFKLIINSGDHFSESDKAWACLRLGNSYENGLGIKKSGHLAFQFYEKAFQIDPAIGAENLAKAYMHGIGVHASENQAYLTYRKAITHYLDKANSGDDAACCFIGNCYLNGLGIEESIDQAEFYFLLGANHGNSCFNELALLYFYEKLPDPSFEKAHYYNRILASLGNGTGMWRLGKLYEYGMGVSQSDEEALKYYKLAFQHCVKSAFECGYILKKLNKYQEANEYFHLVIDDSDGLLEERDNACIELSNSYKLGLGVEISKEKELLYLEKGAEIGGEASLNKLAWFYGHQFTPGKSFHFCKIQADLENPYYQNLIGLFYEKGRDVEKSIEAAIQYYKKASETFDPIERSDIKACLNLARLYREGKDTKLSLEQAFFYYKKAADLGSSDGYLQTAYFYENGLGVEKSYKQSAYYYRLAAEKKSPQAMYSYAMHLKEGKGTIRYPKMANEYFKTIIDKAVGGKILIAKAYAQLGDSYEHGDGIKMSKELAFQCYMKAFEKDNNQSFFLAKAYEYGIGVEKDLEKAMILYTKAADLKDPQSAYRLGLVLLQDNPNSFVLACKYFKIAANANNLTAVLMLAKLHKRYEKNLKWKCLGVNKFLNEKAEELKDKAIQGNSEYEEFLGVLYQNGILVECSLERAQKYYKSAAKHGRLSSYQHLAHLYKHGIGVNQSNLLATYYHKLASQETPSRINLHIFQIGSFL